jgi:VPDSG-CTERM motif
LLVVGLTVALSAARADRHEQVLAIRETGENFDDLIVTFNGRPVRFPGLRVTGQADNWTITLPTGWSVFQNNVVVGESANANAVNLVSLNGNQITWLSDVGGRSNGRNTVIIPSAGTESGGAIFSLRLHDGVGGPSVPDSGATAMLLGVACTGLGFFRRFVRR